MTLRRSILTGLFAVALALLLPTVSVAQSTDARAHFERGVALFDEGRHEAALAEFEAAYSASPNYRVLYNLAQVHARLGHAVRAADTYARFLSEGADNIDSGQRARAEAELATQRARVGSLDIVVAVAGAAVSIDGSEVARTPLSEPIRVSVGEHLVAISAAGYVPQQRRVSVAGQAVARVEFELEETGSARGSIRVTTNVRDVEISVDGEVVGRTPLEGSLSVSSGLRDVRATRPGYASIRRSVEVGMGAEAELDLTLEADLAAASDLGRLRVRVPLGASVFLDGEPATPPGPLRLPVGDHELRVEMPDIVTRTERVQVVAESDTEVEPELRLTPDARASRLADASTQRTIGAALSIVGGVLIAGGAGLVIWNEIRRNELDFDQRSADLTRCAMQGDPTCIGTVLPAGTNGTNYPEMFDAVQAQFNSDVTEFNVITGLGYGMIVLGAGSILTSVLVLVSTPSDEDAVRVQASAGLGRVSLDGTF